MVCRDMDIRLGTVFSDIRRIDLSQESSQLGENEPGCTFCLLL